MFLNRELGIGIVPYSPLGRGFFAGKAVVETLPENSLLVCVWQNFMIITFRSIFSIRLTPWSTRRWLLLNLILICFWSVDLTSTISRGKFGQEQDHIFASREFVNEKWLHSSSTGTVMDFASRRRCGTYSRWVTLICICLNILILNSLWFTNICWFYWYLRYLIFCLLELLKFTDQIKFYLAKA